MFMAALPKVGVGALHKRSADGVAAGDQPLTIMMPDGKFYTKLAADAAEHQVHPLSPLLLLPFLVVALVFVVFITQYFIKQRLTHINRYSLGWHWQVMVSFTPVMQRLHHTQPLSLTPHHTSFILLMAFGALSDAKPN